MQYSVGLLVTAPLAVWLEPMRVEWTGALFGSLAYLVVGNSLVAISLLLAMLRHGEASRVSALFFLVPPCSAVIAYAALDEAIPALAWLGMALAALGILLVTRARPAPPGSTGNISGGQVEWASSRRPAHVFPNERRHHRRPAGFRADPDRLAGGPLEPPGQRRHRRAQPLRGLSVAAGAAVPRHDPGRSGRHDALGYVGAFAGGIAITFVAGFASRRRARARALTDRSIEGLAAAYANAGYMGIPLCVALFGAESLAPAAFATLLTASVLFGCAIALIELDRQQAPGLGATLLKVGQALMRNPLLAAPVAGLAWAATGIALPEGLDRYVTLLGASASPCALVAIGLFLAQTETASPGPGVLRLVLGKLLLQPAATAALAFLVFDMPPLWAWTAVLMSALPIGTGPFMLARMYGRDARLTSRAILVSTLASVLTISLLVAWISAHPIN